MGKRMNKVRTGADKTAEVAKKRHRNIDSNCSCGKDSNRGNRYYWKKQKIGIG